MGKVSSLLFLGFSRIKFFVLFGLANGVNILLKDPGSYELKYLCIKIFELTSSISLNLRILSLKIMIIRDFPNFKLDGL